MFGSTVETTWLPDPGVLDDELLVQALRHSERLRRELAAHQARLVDELDRRTIYRRDGHASVCGLIRTVTKRPTSEAKRLASRGRMLREHPAIAAALGAGDLGVAQADLLARANAHPRCRGLFAAAVDVLLDAALTLKYSEFETVVERWINLADSDGADQRAAASHANRDAWIYVGPDGFHAQVQGGVIHGTTIAEIHGRFVQAEWDKDWAATQEQHGDAACAALMPRTDRQRRADAFVAMCEAAVSTPPGAQPPEPVVNLVTDPVTFCKVLALFFGIPVDSSTDAAAAQLVALQRRRCETSTGVAVAPTEVLAAALAGHLRRVVLDARSVVIDMGRKQRLFTGYARIAAHMGHARCIWPGCEVPAARCHTDHLTDWQHGGTTSPDHGGPGCPRHNLFKQNRGYTITRHPDGTLHTYRPDGSEVA